MNEKGSGTWVPAEVFKTWESLRLDSSTWNTFLAIANQQYRYGGTEAHITLQVVADRTGYSIATVKRSVAELQKKNLLTNLKRGHWRLKGISKVIPSPSPEKKCESIDMVIPQKYQHNDTFTILLFSSSINKEENSIDAATPFTKKQISMLNSLFIQISELLCENPMELAIPNFGNGDTQRTYGSWLREIVAAQDRREAGRFVGAMLKLRKDERVVGRELR